MTSTQQSPDMWAQLVNMVGELAEEDTTGGKERLYWAMILTAMEQALKSEQETEYTRAAKEAIALFAQAGYTPDYYIGARQGLRR